MCPLCEVEPYHRRRWRMRRIVEVIFHVLRPPLAATPRQLSAMGHGLRMFLEFSRIRRPREHRSFWSSSIVRASAASHASRLLKTNGAGEPRSQKCRREGHSREHFIHLVSHARAINLLVPSVDVQYRDASMPLLKQSFRQPFRRTSRRQHRPRQSTRYRRHSHHDQDCPQVRPIGRLR